MFLGNLNSNGDYRMGKYTHLSISDRRRFYTFIEMGLPISEIAKRLSKHRSTLYRELNRNSNPEGYFSKAAQLKTYHRAKQKCPSKLQKRYSRQKSPCRYGKIRLITERPEDIATRKRFGHWEGDTIQFKCAKEK